MPKLKIVIYSLSDYSFIHQLCGNNSAKVQNIFYRDVFGINGCNTPVDYFNITDYSIISNIGFRGLIVNMNAVKKANSLANDDMIRDSFSEGLNSYSEKYILMYSKIRAKSLYNNYNEEIFKNNINRISNSIELTKNNNVYLVLLLTPGTPFYRKYINEEIYKNGMTEIESLVSKNPKSKILNLFEDSDFQLSDFSDVDHLNTSGNIKLSKKINEFLINKVFIE